MAATKKNTTKKTPVKTQVKEVRTLTDEEKILGVQADVVTNTTIDYESPERFYQVTNLEFGNTPVKVDGTVIESFIGSTNREARMALKSGAEFVICKDMNGKEVYKIEVI